MRCVVSLAIACALVPARDAAAQQKPELCDRYEAAVRADSTSARAWFELGRCTYRDYEMIAPGGDSSRLAFRTSWTTARRALRRSLELDPSDARAYRPLFMILFSETRDGCSFVTSICSHVAPNIRDADTLITIPRLVVNSSPDPYGAVLRESEPSHRANLAEARDVATRWVARAPDDRRPHEWLGRALVGLGVDPSSAATELERAAALGTMASRRMIFWDRFEALVKADRGADARSVLDEAARYPGEDSSRFRVRITGLDALVGRFLLSDRLDVPRQFPDGLIPGDEFTARFRAGDLDGARRVLAHRDSILLAPPDPSRFGPVMLQPLFQSALLHVAAGDTAKAEARLAELERLVMQRPFEFNLAWTTHSLGSWLGDAWLLSGDIAAKRRHLPEAARMYRRVIGLWDGGDVRVQPIVLHARDKLASLASR